MTTVPLLDLKAQYATIRGEIELAIAEVFETQRFIGGPKVTECEEAVAAYSSCSHGIGVSSGTDALLVSLMAEGIGAGDEVITTPYTFFATGGCIARVGARPVFVDIDPVTYNIDPQRIDAAITPATRAVIPVHLFGQMADMDPIMDLARARSLCVIEDAAQAIGAEYKGRRAGSIGDYGCFSFFPSKNLGAAGDGGMVVTNDAERAERVARLRNHGAKPKYFHQTIGGNFRLDALQAAIVAVKLRHLDAWTEARQQNAQRWGQAFEAEGLVDATRLALPVVLSDRRHIFNQYVVRTELRDELREHLKADGIGTEIYYPRCLHRQECFADLGYPEGALPASEFAAAHTFAIPVYPELRDDHRAHVVASMARFFLDRLD